MRRTFTMRRLVHLHLCGLIVGLVLLATACGVATGPGTGLTGTIAGSVMAGPTCPVERVDNPCPDKPVTNRQVNILAASSATANATPQTGNVVASTTTDANGNFSVNVPPGQYVVQVGAGPGMLGQRQETPGDVTVTANQTTTIKIVLDTGIR